MFVLFVSYSVARAHDVIMHSYLCPEGSSDQMTVICMQLLCGLYV